MIGKTLGHYEITDEIGAGGMGVVYRARDVRLNRSVAFKVLAPDFVTDPERRSRFLQEARSASAVNHPASQISASSTRIGNKLLPTSVASASRRPAAVIVPSTSAPREFFAM